MQAFIKLCDEIDPRMYVYTSDGCVVVWLISVKDPF